MFALHFFILSSFFFSLSWAMASFRARDAPIDATAASEVRGVIVITRNGDRTAYAQDPKNYEGRLAETTALGEVQSHQLGSLLRDVYLNPGSSSYIKDMSSELVDNREINVRVKAGGEGSVVFDSAIALLQGLFPPNPKNRIELANGRTFVAPLGGYQYVPVETVEPGNDRSLESWTSCPAFQQHVAKVEASDAFKAKAKEAEPFFKGVKDYVFGRPTTFENIYNIHDFVSTELNHNRTYAYRLPPSYAEQSAHFANFHEYGVFSDKNMGGIGNVAGRTLLHTIHESLTRIAFDSDPLQFLVVATSYHSFLSLFSMTEVTTQNPEVAAIPDFASALTIELRRGAPPDSRDFLRFKFKNGTEDFKTLHVFNHMSDIPLTEFIYRTEDAAITSNKQWAKVCGASSAMTAEFLGDVSEKTMVSPNALSAVIALLWVFAMGLAGVFVKRTRDRKAASKLRLEGEDGRLVQNIRNTPVMEKVRHI